MRTIVLFLMRSKIKILILATLILLGSLMTSCPAPLGFSGVRSPNVIQDGTGGAITVYQVNENDTRVTYAQRVGAGGNTLWGKMGITLYSEPGPSGEGGICASVIESTDGSSALVWDEERSIWAQKLDLEGHFLWGEGIVQVTDGIYNLKAVSDSLGGVIIAWSDSHDRLSLQRVDSKGDLLWPKDILTPDGAHFDIAGDPSGSAFAVWQNKALNVFVQKVDSEGKVSWTPGGLKISTGRGTGDMHGIVSDKAGGAIVAWVQEKRGQDGQLMGQELYAQRIGADGKVLWRSSGISVWIGTPAVVDPQVLENGAGGAIIFWRDPRSIWAQRLDANGNVLWAQDGVQVWKAEGPQSPSFSMVEDGEEGAIVVWRYVPAGGKVDQNHILSAQRLGSNGQKLWADNGILVSTASTGYSSPPQISQDGSCGVIVAWAAGKSVHNASSSYIQRISAEGRPLWGEVGVKLNP